MTAFENLSTSQKLRASLHRDVRAICTEALHLLGMEMTKPAMEIVAELVYKKLSLYGTDLEAFAKHAKRNTINAEDVKLMARRNPSLKTHLNTIQPANPAAKDKRRKTVASTSTTKQFATPLAKSKEVPRSNTEVKRPVEDRRTHVEEIISKDFDDKAYKASTDANDVEGSKDDSIERRITNEVEQMSVDETIDLTFD